MKNKPTLSLVTCYAGMTTLAIAINLMPVYLPLLRHDFAGGSLTNEQLGRLSAVTFVGLVGGILLTGPLANRHPAKIFTVAGNLFIAGGLAWLSLAQSYLQLLLAVGTMGFGAGILDLILSPIVCALQPENRTRAMNWLHSFYCVGAIFTILLATFALAWISWTRLALALASLPLAVATVFIFLPLPPLALETSQRTKVRHLLLQPFFLWVVVAIFLGGATEMGLAQWLPAFAVLDLKTSQWIGGGSFLLFSLAMALGRMTAGTLGHGLSIYQLIGLSCGSTALLFVVAGFCPLPGIALTAAIAAGFTGSCLWPSILGMAGDHYPRAGASMFGVLSAAGNFGGILMPWGVGLIADKNSIGTGLAVSALCPILLLLMRGKMARAQSGR